MRSSLALKSNGTVEAWGQNKEGELGNGTKTNRDVPGAVSDLGKQNDIAGGGFFAMAWGEPGPTETSLSPTSGGIKGGTEVTIKGKELTEVVEVRFGTTPATGVTTVSSTEIVATAPAGTKPGTSYVTVVTKHGVSVGGTKASKYTYVGEELEIGRCVSSPGEFPIGLHDIHRRQL